MGRESAGVDRERVFAKGAIGENEEDEMKAVSESDGDGADARKWMLVRGDGVSDRLRVVDGVPTRVEVEDLI